MNHNKFSAFMAGMLLFAFSQGLAQQNVPEFNREIVLGANTGGETFNPRALYKRTNKKRTLRVSLEGSWLLTNQSPVITDSCQTSTNLKSQSTSATLGLGYEKRKPLGDNFSFYHGMEFRLSYGRNNTKVVQIYEACEGYYEQWESENLQRSTTISWHPFIGLRYDLKPRLALAIEAGPEIGIGGSIDNYQQHNIVEENNLIEEHEIDRSKGFSVHSFFRFFDRPFLSLAYQF